MSTRGRQWEWEKEREEKSDNSQLKNVEAWNIETKIEEFQSGNLPTFQTIRNEFSPPLLNPSDPFLRGWEYLQVLRQMAPVPEMIEITDDISNRIRMCTWIGKNIDAVNLELNSCLEVCHQCFSVEQQAVVQILAAPLASQFGIDGLCNILLDPSIILIDVGRVAPPDWLSLVVHEYAHAHLKSPGHDQRFLAALTHLCLGLGLEPPSVGGMEATAMAAQLRNWPHCESTTNPLAFWIGAEQIGATRADDVSPTKKPATASLFDI